jgi:hypothetical protein
MATIFRTTAPDAKPTRAATGCAFGPIPRVGSQRRSTALAAHVWKSRAARPRREEANVVPPAGTAAGRGLGPGHRNAAVPATPTVIPQRIRGLEDRRNAA